MINLTPDVARPQTVAGRFRQSLDRNSEYDPRTVFSDAQIEAAEGSVRALIADLRYIMGNREASSWPSLAAAALQHHSPGVPANQLTKDFAELQTRGRAALEGIIESDFEAIREAVIAIRAVEAKLH